MKTKSFAASRRACLKLALIPPAALVLGRIGHAAEKTPKAAVNYQDTPQAGQQCSGCVHFIDGGQCKLVAGEISPQGWCTLFKAKS